MPHIKKQLKSFVGPAARAPTIFKTTVMIWQNPSLKPKVFFAEVLLYYETDAQTGYVGTITWSSKQSVTLLLHTGAGLSELENK